jgi:NADH dehydrogenase FAD-containing subunit
LVVERPHHLVGNDAQIRRRDRAIVVDLDVALVEAASKLVEGFDDRLSDDVYNRLIELGVHVRVSSRVAAVDRNFVELMSGEKIAHDALIWTAGVKASVPDCGSG